jgi:hypothetical protein
MNVDCNLDSRSFESVRNIVTRETILAIIEANSGMTLGGVGVGTIEEVDVGGGFGFVEATIDLSR